MRVRNAAPDVKYFACTRRAAAEIRVTQLLFPRSFHLGMRRGRRRSFFLYSSARLLREVWHDISKGELLTPGMSDRVHFANFSYTKRREVG